MDKQSNPPVLQRQRSVQDTIQRHFSQILKNDSITVTDQTSMTETLMKQENNPTTCKYAFRVMIDHFPCRE